TTLFRSTSEVEQDGDGLSRRPVVRTTGDRTSKCGARKRCRSRDSKRPAQHRDRESLFHTDELVAAHEPSFAKKAVAFFKISRSIVSRLFSRRRRASSARSSVVRASAVPPCASTWA